MDILSPSHLLILLLVVLLLFGSARLPKAAKSLGEAMRIFKGEAQKMHQSSEASAVQAPYAQPELSPVAPQVPAAQTPVAQPVAAQPAPAAPPVVPQAPATAPPAAQAAPEQPTDQPG